MKLHVEGFGSQMEGYEWFASGPVRNLKREASEDMKALRKIVAEHKQLQAENAKLREVLATAQRDANRYRWLRIQDRDDLSFAVLEGAHWRGAGDCDPYFFDNSEELDAAIDEAMKEQP